MVRIASEQENQIYFASQLADGHRWANRVGAVPSSIFTPNSTVLDFGSGHGALCVKAAELGAEVVGIDINPRRVGFAERTVADRYPALASRISFVCGAVEDLPGSARFDVIVSKDTFEHVSGLDGVLVAFRRLLKPGGRVFVGFSPLWYSPFGDHGFLSKRRVPWAHLLLGEARFLQAHNAYTGRDDRTVAEAGFNQLKPADFRAAFQRNGFRVERSRVNPASPLKRMMFLPLDLARRHNALEAFATVGIYATLRIAADATP